MKKSITDVSYDELKKDYNEVIRISKELMAIEDKYEALLGRSVTLFSVKNGILQELGRRDLNK